MITDGTALLLPVMSGLPPLRDASEGALRTFREQALRWNAPSSLTGSAQAVVPVRHERSGLTYGVGLLGGRGHDSSLLAAVCSAFEDAWKPPVAPA